MELIDSSLNIRFLVVGDKKAVNFRFTAFCYFQYSFQFPLLGIKFISNQKNHRKLMTFSIVKYGTIVIIKYYKWGAIYG